MVIIIIVWIELVITLVIWEPHQEINMGIQGIDCCYAEMACTYMASLCRFTSYYNRIYPSYSIPIEEIVVALDSRHSKDYPQW